MDDRTLAIPIGFILLAALLCWMLIGAKGSWWLKLATILIVPAFGLAVWAAISSYKGWPTADEPPEKAVLIWGVVREPDPRHDDPGAIYLWLMPVREEGELDLNPFDYTAGGGEPRSYKMPYTRQLHDALTAAQAAAKEGRPMMFGKGKRRGGRGHGVPGREGDSDGEGEGRGNGGQEGEEEEQFQFYDLPPATPTRKQPEQ